VTQVVSIWRFIPEGSIIIEDIYLKGESSSLNQASEELPQGGYTTLRTYGKNKALHLEDHFARLEETARLSGVIIQMDWSRVRSGLRQALAAFPAPEARVRLTVDQTVKPGTLYISIEPLSTPSTEAYALGVAVTTQSMRRLSPKAKLTGFISRANEIRRQSAPENIEEVLMVAKDGRILEGLTSNFFAFYQGEIWTAEEGVLPGITRSIVLEECQNEKLRIRLSGFPLEEIPALSEAFITSTSRAVLPVTRIDNFKIGSGLPGPITNRILERYQQRVSVEVQPI
jgi:branched-chain amino acid aminotransferase